MYIDKNIRATRRLDLDNINLEAVWVEIWETANKRLVVGVVYRPPSSDSAFMFELSEVLQLLRLELKEIVILGDLNCNILKADGPTKQLLDILADNELYQLVTAATRVTQESETIIDLLITNEPVKFVEVGCRECCISDHKLVYGTRNVRNKTPKRNHEVSEYRAYNKCCIEALRRDLDRVPWHILDIFDDIEDSWCGWKLLFDLVLDEHAPIKKSRKKRQHVPWITEEVRELFKIRDHLGKKARKTKDEEVWIEYRMVRNYVTAELRRSKRAYLEGIALQSRRQPKRIWNELNKLMGQNVKTPISLLRTEQGDIADNSGIANALNNFFISRIEHMATGIDAQISGVSLTVHETTNDVMPKFEFMPADESTVLGLLSNLDVCKTTGCDNIQARALKLTAEAIARPLCNLINRSLTTTQIPLEWKSANVTPVPKNGDEMQMENYRPISVLPVISKVMERIVFNQLYDFLQQHSLLSQHQSGFRPNHSTQDVLIKTVDDWRKSVDQDYVVGALFLDLSKAFDMINHELLLKKMRLEFGVVGRAEEWFRSYLSGRRQRVCVGQATSPWMTPRFGVPQGSILGPLMFILFVNALPKAVKHCSTNMYADDTTIYTAAETTEQALETLSIDANSTMDWYRQNKLIVNVEKTHLMVIGRRYRKMEINEAKLVLQDVELRPEQTVSYLGVSLDDQFKWKDHVKKIRSKCFMGLAKLRRVCKDLPMAVRKKLYCAMIQPHTDYCSVVWDQLSVELRNKVEVIQNVGMRIILGAPRTETGTSLRQKLKWTTLAQRRKLHALTVAHKCIYGAKPKYLRGKFQLISEARERQTRASSSAKVCLDRPRTECYKQSFEYSTAKHWNSLSPRISSLTETKPFLEACKKVLYR